MSFEIGMQPCPFKHTVQLVMIWFCCRKLCTVVSVAPWIDENDKETKMMDANRMKIGIQCKQLDFKVERATPHRISIQSTIYDDNTRLVISTGQD